MMADGGGARRLDSWKAIASYLNRDERTVRRWERELGLPIRRLPAGPGRSVFAYVAEVEEWLRSRSIELGPEPALVAEAAEVMDDIAGSAPPAATRSRRPALLVAAAVVVLSLLATWANLRRADHPPARVRITPDGVTAIDRRGAVQWRYPFSTDYGWAIATLDLAEPWRVFDGAHPGAYAVTSFKVRRSDEQTESGELFAFTADGKVERKFSFDDTVAIGGSTYRAPWAITSFAVDESNDRRLTAVAAHHYIWNPGIVAVLDDHFARLGTFYNDGWIEAVRWLAPNRLLIAGFSNTYDGGMAALLDPTAPGGIDGQGPEPAGSARFCTSCPRGAPLRMLILPRSDLNRATHSPFNRVFIQDLGDRILLRTIEVPGLTPRPPADVIYEFRRSLDLISATYSDEYLSQWRRLGSTGNSSKTPQSYRQWEPATGWRTIKVP